MRIAIVAPRMGTELVGGAEFLCLEVARQLNVRGVNAELLSTTVADYHRYEDAYPPGESRLGDVVLRRFSPDRKSFAVYDRLGGELYSKGSLTPADEAAWFDNSLNSSALLDFLESNQDSYDFIVFFQYLRGLTYRGVQRFPGKALVCPLLHNEPFARLSLVGEMLNQTAGILFNSEGEKSLAIELHGLSRVPKTIAGLGFDPIKPPGKTFEICSDPYILYTGRIEEAKNIPRLIDFFARYKAHRPDPLKLVLCGDVRCSLPENEALIVAGYLSREQLYRAYANAIATVQPSDVESFSISIFESWQHGRPVLVSANCNVTPDLCIRSNGGLYFRDYGEFQECLDRLIANPDLALQLGRQGQAFVSAEYSWPVIIQRYIDFFSSFGFYRAASQRRMALVNFNLLANDAVGNNLVNKFRVLADSGCGPEIYLESLSQAPPNVQVKVQEISVDELCKGRSDLGQWFWAKDLYFFDYAVHYALLDLVSELKRRNKTLLFDYHGITPPHLWDDQQNLKGLEDGIRHIPLLQAGRRVIAHSEYMRSELAGYGIDPSRIDVIPYAVPLHAFFPMEKDPQLMQWYGLTPQDFVLLYVGRMAGNKRIDVLARAFGLAARSMPQVRLMLVGDYNFPPYQRQAEKARRIAREYGAGDRLILTGAIQQDELNRYFNLCDLYVTSSLHEGFCIPVVEAMACGKPVIASRSTALPETVGDAGILFEPENAEELAQHILRLAGDVAFYEELAMRGLERSKRFSPDIYRKNMLEFFRKALD